MSKPVKFVFTARDTNQSWGYTIPNATMQALIGLARDAGIDGIEITGGGDITNNSFKKEEDIFANIAKASKLSEGTVRQYLHRGDALNTYAAMPDDVADLFMSVMAKYVDRVRLFAGTNDIRDMENTIELAAKYGVEVQAELSFSYRADGSAYPDEYWLDKAQALKDSGVGIVGFKDFSGVMRPEDATRLTVALTEMGLQTSLHMHETSGRANATYEAFIAAGGGEVHVAPDAIGGHFGQPKMGEIFDIAQKHGRAPELDAEKLQILQAAAAKIDVPDVADYLKKYAKIEFGGTLFTPEKLQAKTSLSDDQRQNMVDEKIAEYKGLIELSGVPGGGFFNFIQRATTVAYGYLGDDAYPHNDQKDILGDYLKTVTSLREMVGEVGLVTPYYKMVDDWAVMVMNSGGYRTGELDVSQLDGATIPITPAIHDLIKGEFFEMPNPINTVLEQRVIAEDVSKAVDAEVAGGAVDAGRAKQLKAHAPVIAQAAAQINQLLAEGDLSRQEYVRFMKGGNAPEVAGQEFGSLTVQLQAETVDNLLRAAIVLQVAQREVMEPGRPEANQKLADLAVELLDKGAELDDLAMLATPEAELLVAMMPDATEVKKDKSGGSVKMSGLDVVRADFYRAHPDLEPKWQINHRKDAPEFPGHAQAQGIEIGAAVERSAPEIVAKGTLGRIKQQPTATDIVNQGKQGGRAGQEI